MTMQNLKSTRFPSKKQWVTTALVTLVLSSAVQACPVCFSAPDSAETRGMTVAILFLLGLVGMVVCGVASFFIYLIAKERNPEPGHQELAHLAYDEKSTAH